MNPFPSSFVILQVQLRCYRGIVVIKIRLITDTVKAVWYVNP